MWAIGLAKLDVGHALAAHLGQPSPSTPHFSQMTPRCPCRVLAAQALVVLDRPEDLGAEQAVAFRA